MRCLLRQLAIFSEERPDLRQTLMLVEVLIFSTSRVRRYSDSEHYTTHHRTDSIRIEKNEEMMLYYFFACLLQRGIYFVSRRKILIRNVTC